jgi:hypothetical protein
VSKGGHLALQLGDVVLKLRDVTVHLVGVVDTCVWHAGSLERQISPSCSTHGGHVIIR